MHTVFLLASLCASTHGTVLKNVSLPPIEYASYSSTDVPLQINCADEWIMELPGFSAMEKVWRKNRAIDFNTANIVFTGSNGSIQFSSLQPDDCGNYDCCMRNVGEKEYYCTTVNLTVVESVGNVTSILDASASTSKENGTIWEVQLGLNDTLIAQEAYTYFLILFSGNATDVHCVIDGEVSVETKSNVRDPASSADYDMVIRSFNSTVHSGNYYCKGTYLNGNATEMAEAYFSVAGSQLSNPCENCTDVKKPMSDENFMTKKSSNIFTTAAIFLTFFLNCKHFPKVQ